jgi:hypothetical protein
MISEQTSDQNSNYIPTIVNGQINPTKNDKNENSADNNRDYVLNLVRESTAKVLDNKCAKHKILVMGDSHGITPAVRPNMAAGAASHP